MGITEWLKRTRMQVRRYGYRRGLIGSVIALRSGLVARTGRILPNRGEFIFDREWDGLIVLDACRVDALEELADEYEFIPADVPSIISRASMSESWLRRNFTTDFRDKIGGTAYVSANGHTNGFDNGEFEISTEDFEILETVSEYSFDESMGTIPPRAVTDVGINYLRDADPDRFILHYMQPHTPYRGLDLEGVRGDDTLFRENVWDLLHVGKLSREEVWEYYLDTLRWVLDEVEVVLENVNADSVIITADHGECFGERWMYGHPRYGWANPLREVPWIQTQATDTRSYTPEPIDRSTETASLEKQLEALGYR